MNKRTIAIAVAIFLAGGLGTAVGVAGAATPTPATITKTVAGPERVVTKTVPGPERVVTVQGPERIVTKEVTPQACLNAIDAAKTVIQAVSVEHTAFGDAASQAGSDGDMVTFVNSMKVAMDDMTAVVHDQTGPMGTAVAACRAGS